ncbi:MAG: divergent polysaccharide deacetylase family protein [Pseudomonadota bacterium]|nr:divergent polysaccharide deacetylase family protein [Pseudomonadota bacterium]
MLRITTAILTLSLALMLPTQSGGATRQASPQQQVERPKIAIILDDLGYNRPAGEQALQLPGNITYAIIPFTPHGVALAQAAHDRNREVILHLPMESSDPDRRLDQGGLTSDLDEQEVKQRVQKALDAVPHIVGLNNHMGSSVTADVNIMHWLMQAVQDRPLYFIDSMTNPHSVANHSALHYQIPSLKRDIFLDNVQSEAAIDRMFRSLVRIARKRGHAIAIGHPYPATLDYLAMTLPRLESMGVELVDASELVMYYGQPVDQPIDLQEIMDVIVAMPAPASQRLNFSN